MTNADTQKLPPYVPFLYEMVISFFETARIILDPVLQDIDGYRDIDFGHDGRPTSPEHVAYKLAELPPAAVVNHVSSCLTATTNLGLAYVHTLRLLNLLERRKDTFSPNAAKPQLAKLYDSLSKESQIALGEIYDQVGTHDFEMELSSIPFAEDRSEKNPSSARNFRSMLAYWDSRKMMQDSHLSLSDDGCAATVTIFIPFRSVLILDHILANKVAPALERDYKTIEDQLSSRIEEPRLEWDGEMIHVKLSDIRGRITEARWNPTVTSVIRIRETGALSWSPGFETPFNMCTFAGLSPDTEYEVKLTHKNQAGESEPAISTMKTAPNSK